MHLRTWNLKGSNATSQTTVATSAVTGTDYPQVGDVVFVGVGHDNSGAAVPTLSSVAISGAGAVDSWRIKSQGTAAVSTAAGSVQADGAWGIVTTAFTAATVITATLSAAVTAKVIGVGCLIGDDIVPSSGTAGTSGTGQLSANSGTGVTFGVEATESSTPLGVNVGTLILQNTGGSGASAAQVSITMVSGGSSGVTVVAPSDGGFTWFGMKSLAAVSLTGNGIGSGEAFGTPSISGGSSATTVSPTAIGSGEAFGTPSASTPLTVSPTGISSAEGFGTPVVATPIVASPSGIASAEAFGSPTIAQTLTVSPTAIGSGGAFGTPVIPAAGMHNINPPGGTWWTTSFNDGQSGGISVANPFYTTDSGWSLTGARVYFNSAMITALGAGNSVSVFVMGDDTGVINTLAQLTDGLVTVPSSAGWASVTFSSPISMTANTRYWVGYHTTGEYEAYNYSSTGTLYQATDGSNLFMGRPVAQTTWDVSEFEYRSSNYIAAPTTSNFWWGIDVIAGIPSGGTTTISPSGVTSAEAFGTASILKQLTASPIGITPPVSINSEASYNFDTSGTTFLDQTGHGHTATLVGDAAWSSSGVGGSAGAISNPIGRADGSGATIPRTGLEPTSAITVMAWVRLKENTGAWAVALSKSRAGAGDSYAIYTHHQSLGKPAFYFNTTNGEAAVPQTASGTLPINTWYHLTGTYDGANGKFYIDAVLQDTVAITGSLVYDTTNLSLLTSLAFTNETIAADIDDVRILTGVALTQAEIAEARATRVGAEGQFGSPTITMGAAGITASPSAIPTAEVFGTLSVTSILTAITQGIASGELFGNPSISATISISPVGISSAEAFGTLSVSAALTVSPTGGVSAESFGTVNVTLVLSVNPSGVPPGEAFGTPVITTGGGPTTVSPTGIASVEAFGTLTYSGTRTVSPVGVGSLEAFGTPVITSGGVVLSPTAISTAESFGTPSITKILTVSPTGIAGPGGVPFTTYIKNTYSPKLEWMMDETSGTVATDSSGNAKDGTITGSPTLGAAGIINDGGTGILFDGVNGKYIVGPLENTLSLNQWTVIAFAKTSSTVEQTLAQRSGTGNGRFQIKNSWGTADGKMYVQNDENLAFVATPASVADGTGRMLAFRQDATTLKIFQNGGTQLASVASAAAGTNVQNGTLYVGANNSGLKVWNGTLDGFIVVAGALTTTQLDDIYAASQAAAASQFGTLTITQVLNVLTNSIPTDEGFGTPSVSTQLTSSPTGIASTEAFGTPALSFAVTYSPIGIASAESVSPVVITAGGIVLSPTSIVSAQAIGVPSITQSTPLSPSGIPSGETFGTVVITKTLTVLPSGINSSLAFGTLTATISPDIRPTPIPSAEAFGTPVIGGGIPTTVGTAYTAGVGIEVGVYLSGHPQLIWPAPTPPVTQAALPDPTVAPTLSASDTSGGALPDGTYRYSYAAWRGTVAQCTKPSPTADISITVNDTVTLTYPTIPGADGYIVYREKIA